MTNDEIELPEPAFKLRWKGAEGRYTVSEPNIGDTDCYTANQVQLAIIADRSERRNAEIMIDLEDVKVEAWPTEGMKCGMVKGIKVIHTPTGITVCCDAASLQHLNRESALVGLKGVLNNLVRTDAQRQEILNQ